MLKDKFSVICVNKQQFNELLTIVLFGASWRPTEWILNTYAQADNKVPEYPQVYLTGRVRAYKPQSSESVALPHQAQHSQRDHITKRDPGSHQASITKQVEPATAPNRV